MKEKILFFSAVILASVLRLFLIIRDSVPFAYDMGRDLLWAKDLAFYHIPTLIGPAASIWGVYFGPLWFYFLAPPLALSGGNPQSAVWITAAAIVLTGILAYLLFKKYLSGLYALALAIIFLFSYTLINISTFAFHANVLPILTLIMIYFCFLATVKNPSYLAASFLAVSLMFHADPAPAVALTLAPVAIFFYFKLFRLKSLKKTVFLSVLAYLIPFIPQILFEVRNNFVEVRSLIAYFLGQNPSLSGKLPPIERIFNRLDIFFDFFKNSFAGGNNAVGVVFLAMTVFGIYKFLKHQKNQNLVSLFKINLFVLTVAFLMFTFPITVEIKNWYLYGLVIPLGLLIVFALYGFRRPGPVLPLFLAAYLAVNLWPLFSQRRIQQAKNDPAQLANQLGAIDLVYEDAASLPFSVYTFTPVIYDLNWQYLFWWQGIKLKKGLPLDFAYLPSQPAYVRNKNIYARNAPLSKTADVIYLIIENGKENEFYTRADWLKNFKNYRLIWQTDIDRAITVEKRSK